MEHPILNRIRRESFAPLGWFTPSAGDGVPEGTQQVILIGNAGPEMFRRFARERNPHRDQLDGWTVHVVGAMAAELGAEAVYPFDMPPRPFLTWARKARSGHVSPLGLNIHPVYGLWHAFRAALMFPVAFDLPTANPGSHPCENCTAKPCLTSCPVGAFTGTSYDVKACGRHVLSDPKQSCDPGGCKARLACPVGTSYTYIAPQRAFHMAAFRAARQKELE